MKVKKITSSRNLYNKAFSLIELSIAILIIGILISGILEGRSLIKKFRIQTARSLTKHSPVKAIEGLELWLEPTMEDSFLSEETNDGVNLTQWNDINNQKTTKYYAVKSASSKVKYTDSGINNLPSVYFSGAAGEDSFFTLSNTPAANYTLLKFEQNTKFTFFVVTQADSTSGWYRPVFYNGNDFNAGWGYSLYSGHNNINSILNWNVYSSRTVTKKPEIVSSTFFSESPLTEILGENCASEQVSSGYLKLYVNGSIQNINAGSPNFSSCFPENDGVLKIGGFYSAAESKYFSWNGYISEIIVFNTILSDAHRIAVQEYLSQKYNIKLTS